MRRIEILKNIDEIRAKELLLLLFLFFLERTSYVQSNIGKKNLNFYF